MCNLATVAQSPRYGTCFILILFLCMHACRFPVKDHGTVDVSGSGVSLSVSVLVGSDSQGHFDLSSTGCSFNVGKLSVKFHGGAR